MTFVVRALGSADASTVNVTLPGPLPLPGLIAIHDTESVAVHEQPAVVVIVTVAVPPAPAIVTLVGVTEYPQAPACVTVTAVPATVNVPVRDEVDVFAAAAKVVLPEPLPVAPLLIESQAALLVADQVQPVVVVTAEVCEPPDAPMLAVVGDTE